MEKCPECWIGRPPVMILFMHASKLMSFICTSTAFLRESIHHNYPNNHHIIKKCLLLSHEALHFTILYQKSPSWPHPPPLRRQIYPNKFHFTTCLTQSPPPYGIDSTSSFSTSRTSTTDKIHENASTQSSTQLISELRISPTRRRPESSK